MNALADLLQVWGFQDNTIIFADGSLGCVLALDPVDVACWEDERVDGFAERLARFLNAVPAGVDVQFVQEIGTGNEDILSRNASLETDQSAPAVSAL